MVQNVAVLGFPGDSVVKRHEFDPWSGKIPLSLGTTTIEPVLGARKPELLKPACPRGCAPQLSSGYRHQVTKCRVGRRGSSSRCEQAPAHHFHWLFTQSVLLRTDWAVEDWAVEELLPTHFRLIATKLQLVASGSHLVWRQCFSYLLLSPQYFPLIQMLMSVSIRPELKASTRLCTGSNT